jgi:hypothetical protein
MDMVAVVILFLSLVQCAAMFVFGGPPLPWNGPF